MKPALIIRFLCSVIIVSLTHFSLAQEKKLVCKDPNAKAPTKNNSCPFPKSEVDQVVDLAEIVKKCDQSLPDWTLKEFSKLGMTTIYDDSDSLENLGELQAQLKSYQKMLGYLKEAKKGKSSVPKLKAALKENDKKLFQIQKKLDSPNPGPDQDKLTNQFSEISYTVEYLEMWIGLAESGDSSPLDSEFQAYEAAIIDLQENIKVLNEKKKELASGKKNKKSSTLQDKVNEKIQKMADQFRKGPKYQECGLTDLEIYAIAYYTGNGYSNLNALLRSKKSQNEEEVRFDRLLIEAIKSGLDKLAPQEGLVRRGANLPPEILEQHCLGCEVTYPSFTSTSTGHGFHSKHRFVIQSKSGKYIAPLSFSAGEEEVLFKPGAKFRVVNIEGDNYTLEEVTEE